LNQKINNTPFISFLLLGETGIGEKRHAEHVSASQKIENQ